MRTRIEIETEFAERAALGACQSFLLVGIGGAGMAPIARMLKKRGFTVRGTDAAKSDETDRLESEGIEVTIGHTGEALTAGDALVLTDAIDLNQSPEVAEARRLGSPLFRRSQVLGWLLRDKKIIAVTGTHGKTTTTGLAGKALQAGQLDPTIVVGAYVPEFGGSVIEGDGDWAVIEACEAYDSLRDFDPFHVILTNFEPDHLDFHGSWDGLKTAMLSFLKRMPEEGQLIYCTDDPGAVEIAKEFAGNVIAYGEEDELLQGLCLPGEHNRLNAEAARILARTVGVREDVDEALREFSGAERRLQILRSGPIEVIDDYAHHPREILATLQALRERYPDRRLVIAFQPHLYSRTKDFLSEFSESLSGADLLFLTDIYPAREAPLPGISSARIAEQVTCPCHYVPSRHLLPREVAKVAKPGDVVVGMGAGTISSFASDFIAELDRRGQKKIAVVYGGDSAEREVSLHSGRAIHASLVRQGYTSTLVDVSEILLSGQTLAGFTGANRPDLAFLAVHGTHAEDGAIQGLFELLHIPFTGSGIQASALAMDKDKTKEVLEAAGLPVPTGVVLTSRNDALRADLPSGRVIVKPNAQGSTVGLTFVEDRDDLMDAIDRGLRYCSEVLVEEWIEGVEISIPVLVDQVLPAVEIVPASGRYDFEMKYTPGATEEVCPARLPQEILQKASDYALAAHNGLGCRGATRTDMIARENGEIVILEINTLPGMTPTSLLPRSADVAGISFDQLCTRILEDALKEAHH